MEVSVSSGLFVFREVYSVNLVYYMFFLLGSLYFVKQGGEDYRLFLHTPCPLDGVLGR